MPKGIYDRVYRPDCKFKDLTGLRFGKRVVVSRAPTPIYRGKLGSSMWNVRCDCGKESIVPTSTIKKTTSCGCDATYAINSGKTRKKPDRTVRNVYYLKRKFGLTLEQFNALREAQNNRCKVCNKEFTITPTVDHDHSCCPGHRQSCGKCIRGLLCMNCNAGLGNLKDNIETMLSAVAYLTDWNTRNDPN